MSTMNATEARNTARALALEILAPTLETAGAVQYGDAKFAFPVTLPDGTIRYFKIEGTVANDKATAKTPAFDPEVAVAKFADEKAEKARKAEEKAAEKARKEAEKANAKKFDEAVGTVEDD